MPRVTSVALVASMLSLLLSPAACSSAPEDAPLLGDPALDADPGTSDSVVPEGERGGESEGEGEAPPEPEEPADPADPAKPTGPLQIWMSPSGNDAKTGLTPADAVKTLTRVQSILVATHGTKAWGHDVQVRIAPGRYVGQSVVWTHTSSTRKITFMPAANDKNRPVFDGCTTATSCLARSFFRLSSRRGAKTNLDFEYLQVIRYPTAFSFDANRDDPSKWNGGNRIFGCWFEDLGNAHAPGLVAPSTAAVRLVNSDANTIANNHFISIENAQNGSLLHAIYAAHGSDRNTITGNRFFRNSGDPIRIRDFSNGNVITKNELDKVGIAAGYTEWYCDHDTRTDCTKVGPECPSWNNEFRDNALHGTATCAPLAPFQFFQDDAAKGCVKPAGAARLATSGNVQNTAQCGP